MRVHSHRDIEGNDDPASPNNLFTLEVLDIMGEMSVLAKGEGFLCAMAPAQSYLDPLGPTDEYSRSVSFNPGFGEWREDFTYHGRNTYAYILAKYGVQVTPFSLPYRRCPVDLAGQRTHLPRSYSCHQTFDFISIQLYEGWSGANYAVTEGDFKGRPAEYLQAVVRAAVAGWAVHFESDPSVGLPSQSVAVSLNQLVIGLGNGWCAPCSLGRLPSN